MKRIVLWLLSTISVVVLLFGYRTSTSGALSPVQETVSVSAAQPGATTSASGTTTTGDVVGTQWGPVQVQLTVDSATITKVSVLQYPQGNSTDDQINSYALPILIQNTLDAQSADISMVSGATVTSQGYAQSLQSALDQAGL